MTKHIIGIDLGTANTLIWLDKGETAVFEDRRLRGAPFYFFFICFLVQIHRQTVLSRLFYPILRRTSHCGKKILTGGGICAIISVPIVCALKGLFESCWT